MTTVTTPSLRTAYFDCYSGISGDMILGALVDLGVDLKEIRARLKSLGLSKGYEIKSRIVKRGLISGVKVDVVVKPVRHPHSRNFKDIKTLISQSELSPNVKTGAVEIFRRIAKAEAKVHHTSMDKVHFHEVGAVDSIVDIVGGVLGMEKLNVKRVFSSPLNVGEGFVECAHGTLPVPAPATLRLLEGIPCFSTGIKKELVTPTGAGMIGYFAQKFQSIPMMKVLHTGYGAGDHVIEKSPNMLRVILGEMAGEGESQTMTMVETNIDDMNPEFYEHVMESLFKAGAVDVNLVRVLEYLRVAIRRGPQQQDARALGKLDVAELRVAVNVAVVAAKRRLEAHRLFDKLRNQRWVRAELALQFRLLGENPYRAAGKAGSRFCTSPHQHHENRDAIALRGQPLSHAPSQLANHARGRPPFGRDHRALQMLA